MVSMAMSLTVVSDSLVILSHSPCPLCAGSDMKALAGLQAATELQ